MATNASRKARGSNTQNLAAEYYRQNGWPFATSAGAGRIGRDIENMLGLAPEVKARRGFSPLAWLRQAEVNADGDLPYVLFRPDGMGPASIGRWGILLANDAFTGLLHRAGYGDLPVTAGAAILDEMPSD